MLPDEAEHARAEEYYFRIEIGPLMRLAQPVAATSFRRLTFMHTTLERLLSAQDVKDLKLEGEPFQTLWSALRSNRLRPLPNRLAGGWPVDMTLRVRNGYLGIRLEEANDVREAPEPGGSLDDTANPREPDCSGPGGLLAGGRCGAGRSGGFSRLEAGAGVDVVG